MTLTVAITGATGFAGRHAVAELIRRGHRLRALVRNPGSAGLPDAIEVVKGGLSDADALRRLVSGADAVVHLAGALTALERAGYFSVNASGTEALVAAALTAGTGRFVHVSSLAAREPQLSDYGASKRAAEDAVTRHAAALNAVILRPPAVYGPGDNGTFPLIRELTRPVAAIPGRRDARFSLIHAPDLARILVAGVEGREQGIHEVSDGKPGGYGWTDLISAAARVRGAPIRAIFLPRAIPAAAALGAETLARLTGRPGLVNRGKIAELYHPDWVCREGSLALAATTGFEKGFPETVAWYREAGWLPPGPPADRSPPLEGTQR
jgi:nucleoside-diphosphate-sugar epimerase